MFRRILVAVDGSGPSDRALASALTLAREQRARLRIVHVADTLPPGSVEQGYGYIDVDAYRERGMIAIRFGRDVKRWTEMPDRLRP